MHRFPLTLVCAFALAAAPALGQTAKAEATKTAAGTIASISGSSVTVKTASGDMTFNIDSKTVVVAPGGSTKARAAQAEGKPGATATDVLKAGQHVEVKYHETGMHASTIRATGSAPAKAAAATSGSEAAPKPEKPAPPKAETASGTVSAVSGNSLTLKGAGGDSTFTVDGKTTVVGTGVGTASRKLMAEGGKPTLGDLVKEGDMVSVTYHDAAGAKQASVIRITRKKM